MPALVVVSSTKSGNKETLDRTIDFLSSRGFDLGQRTEGGEWEDLFPNLLTTGLFHSRTFCIVDDAESLGPMPPTLSPLIESLENAGNVLVVVYEGVPSKYLSRKVLERAVLFKENPVPRWEREKLEMLRAAARDDGLSVSPEALALLIEYMEDPVELRSELSKLAFLAENTMISAEDVRELCFDEGTGSILALLEGVYQAEAGIVLDSLQRLRENHAELLYVLGAVYNKLRLASFLSIYGTTQIERVQKVLNFTNYHLRQAGRMTKRYPAASILSAAAQCVRLSYAEKSGLSSGWIEFETLLLKFLRDGK